VHAFIHQCRDAVDLIFPRMMMRVNLGWPAGVWFRVGTTEFVTTYLDRRLRMYLYGFPYQSTSQLASYVYN
jgi:hypothetical protein